MKSLTTAPLLHAVGLFIVVGPTGPRVALLTESATQRLYSSLELADKPDNRSYLLRQIFHTEVDAFLPAHRLDALLDYAENYAGPHHTQVQGLAACILTGTPFSTDTNDLGGGSKIPTYPTPPAGDSGDHITLNTGVHTS